MPLRKIHKFVISEADAHLRLDHFLVRQIPQISRSQWQKLIEQNHVRINNKIAKSSHKLRTGEQVDAEIPEPAETNLIPENIPLNILFEDEHLLVINKPPGMVVHPGAGVKQHTLVNALMHHCKDLSGVGGRLRPGIVHRLDKDTSGLLVVAKNDISHISLQKQFAEKSARRIYKALVWGRVEPRTGEIETFLDRSKRDRKKFTVTEQGKPAVTRYEVEKYYSFLSLVNVTLKTGRSHQIRVHFQYLNYPVFGDPEYGGRNKQMHRIKSNSQKKFALELLKEMPRQALHAFQLGFVHPVSKKEMLFECPLPDDFQHILMRLETELPDDF